MIPMTSDTRVWLVTGHTDMRKGYQSLALIVQETLKRNPHGGHLFVFRGRRGDLIKITWHDGQGQCLFSKRLERGRFLWPSPADGVVTIMSGADCQHRPHHPRRYFLSRRTRVPRAVWTRASKTLGKLLL